MMPYVSIPQIDAAALTPNPADINGTVTVTVSVAERQIWVEPSVVYAGETYAGEQEFS